MKTMENLIKANGNMKLGNHKKEVEGNTTKYIYHWTAIVTVDEEKMTYTTDNGGYGTRSTSAAINDYKRKLNDRGYACIN
jgi:hypothetical protein